MISFTKKKVKAQTLGEKLKEIRLEADVSLDEIARITKIQKKYLELIEEGAYDKLPPNVYVRGFLKSYANYLDLSEKEVLKLYKKEVGIQDNLKKLTSFSERKKFNFSWPKITITPKVTIAVISLLALLLGAGYFYKEISRFSATPSLVLTQPLGDTTIQNDIIGIAGVAEEGNQVFLNGQPLAVNETGEFQEMVNLRQGLNDLEIKSINRFGNEAVRQIKVAAEFEEKLLAKAENESSGFDGQAEGEKVMGEKADYAEKIRLEIKPQEQSVWVAIKVDETGTQSSTMLPGSTQIFEATDKITITSGKANQTLVKFNDKDWQVLDESPGVVRDVAFERQGQGATPSAEVGEDKGDEKRGLVEVDEKSDSDNASETEKKKDEEKKGGKKKSKKDKDKKGDN